MQYFVYAEKMGVYGSECKMRMFLGLDTAKSAYNAWRRMGYSTAMYIGMDWRHKTPIMADFEESSYEAFNI